MTITQTLKLAITKLIASNITDIPHLEAEILLSKILNKPREFLLAHGEKKLSLSQISNFKSLISRRLKGEPAAYIIGHKEFYGLKFKVDKNILIPRPETELMIEEALKLVTHNSRPTTLIDIGTGSGCVIITLAKKISGCESLATDISTKALTIAKQNARLHGVAKNIKFLKGDLLKPILKNWKLEIACPALSRRNWKFVILANLPYLTPSQIKNSPSIKYEPKLALSAGPDGLKYYRQLFRQINELRAASCELRDIIVLCEIDPGQTEKIKQLIKRELPGATFQIKKDLSGLNRLVIISINQNLAPYNR